MQYFDYRKIAEAADIPAGKLAELSRVMRQDFPNDDMMFELHVLRACLAIRDGHITLEEVLAGETAKQT